jgi:uncharacterized protein (DUF3820 family)
MPSELEKKLLRLALDPAAQPGEIKTCAIKLVESWRRSGLTVEEVFGANHSQLAQQYWAPDFGLCTLNFGKHKGKEFKDIPPSYFRWLLAKLKSDPPNPKYQEANLRLIDEIEHFLKQ